MRQFLCVNQFRRVIKKHFGSAQNFVIWLFILTSSMYLIDRVVFTGRRVNVQVVKSEEVAAKIDMVQEEKVKNAEVQKPVKPVVLTCGSHTKPCPARTYSFYLKSGAGRTDLPTICFNGDFIISPDKKNSKRGINMVVINDKTLAVEDVRTFDVYQGDSILRRYLKLGIPDTHLVFAATLDEASYSMTNESRQLLNLYGSQLIDKLKFRDNFVMIGQKGLSKGNSIEKLQARTAGKEFAEAVEIGGCLRIPLGPLGNIPLKDEDKNPLQEGIEVGTGLINCGVKDNCGDDAFSVQMYTGFKNQAMAKLCVNGKYVFAESINNAGRGLNVAVVSPVTKEVTRIGHFDTFEADGINLEIFLEMLNDKDIVIAVSYDEASTNLNQNIQRGFEAIGSSLINKLSFRDAWVFVGQSGIVGKSPYEKLEFAHTGWPKSIDEKLCVPTKVKGIPLEALNKNLKRKEFCSKHKDLGDFCDPANVDKFIKPAPLVDKSLEKHDIFNIPIIIISGTSYNAMRLQLEGLLSNPGVRPDMITVIFSADNAEGLELAEVFNVHSHKLPGNSKYTEHLQAGIDKAWRLHTYAKYMIFLEEEVIPSSAFLSFIGQCLSGIESDNTVVGISAWNVNGYESTLPGVVYRAETFPGFGFLLKRTYYVDTMVGRLGVCCSNRSWTGWFNGKLDDKEMIIPDVSRVYRLPFSDTKDKDIANLKELFERKRELHRNSSTKIEGVEFLSVSKYEDHLNKLINSSSALSTSKSGECINGKGLGFEIPDTVGKSYSIYYEQDDLKDQRILRHLCKCFHLYQVDNVPIQNLHKDILRFSYRGNMMFLIGSSSSYYKHKPSNVQPVPKSSLKT